MAAMSVSTNYRTLSSSPQLRERIFIRGSCSFLQLAQGTLLISRAPKFFQPSFSSEECFCARFIRTNDLAELVLQRTLKHFNSIRIGKIMENKQ